MTTKQQPTLSPQQVEQFNSDGYLVIPAMFSEQELAILRAEADRIMHLVVNCMLALDANHPRTNVRVWPDNTMTVRKVQPVNDLSPAIAALSVDERLIGPMRQLMGDEPLLMEEKLNYKQRIRLPPDAALGNVVDTVVDDHFPLHHDWGYYAREGYPENTFSSAIAIDDCAGRGPIKVIPGTHTLDPPLKNPDPAAGDGEVIEGLYDPDDRVVIDAEAGSVMLFHAKLLHDSEPNTSGQPRRMMIYSHYPASHGGDPDRRNRGTRQRAQLMEQAYADLAAAGTYTDQFSLDLPQPTTAQE